MNHREIDSIWSTKEKAEQHIREISCGEEYWAELYSIEEFEIR